MEKVSLYLHYAPFIYNCNYLFQVILNAFKFVVYAVFNGAVILEAFTDKIQMSNSQ